MPQPLNPLLRAGVPAAAVPPLELEAPGPNTLQPAARTARSPLLGVLQRRAQALVGCFAAPTESSASEFGTAPMAQTMHTRQAQRDVAIDCWGETQAGIDVLACGQMKQLLRDSAPTTVFWQPTAGQSLDLRNNQLTSFPVEMGQARTLQSLDLSNNQLTSFPAEMGQAKALQFLCLKNNQLTSFPAEMGQAKALLSLGLGNNQLTSFSAEMGQAKALQSLDLSDNQLSSFPAEMGQAKALQSLYLMDNQLSSFPAEMGQGKALRSLNLSNNQLTSFPAEMGQAKALESLNLSDNQLTSFPAEMGQAKALQWLQLSDNQLTRFPAGMGQAEALQFLNLAGNQLNDLPIEISQLRRLRYVDLSNNQFTQVPRALLDLPPTTEINLTNNLLPDAEIVAVRDLMAQRRAAGHPVPRLILPGLAEEAGGLREVVENRMNVHTRVLTDTFKNRLDEVARQFPEQLSGSLDAQRAQMREIARRWTDALDSHAKQHTPDQSALSNARETAALMFQKGQGEVAAYVNDFQHSAGHVLAYAFLALEAQWARTPQAHQHEARRNGVDRLIQALDSGFSWCDTRLCEEVMQTLGLPLSEYAQANDEIVAIMPPPITDGESRDVILEQAKEVLAELLKINPDLTNAMPPAGWRATLVERMQSDHPRVPPEQVEKNVQEFELFWPAFHDMVVETRPENE